MYPLVAVTVAVSVVATLADSALLYVRRSYFTGGFLATDYLTGPAQTLAFLLGSVLTDAALAAVIVSVVLFTASRLRMPRNAALAAAFVLALIPVAVLDFVDYELSTYLGDAFDLRLMFELAGRSPTEFLAVSAPQVGLFLLGAIAVVSALAGAVWLAKGPLRRGPALARIRWQSALAFAVLVAVAGGSVMVTLRMRSDVLDNGLRRKPAGQILGTVVQRLSDVDADGYGLLGRPADPALFDERIAPYALDIPGNGVDEDGVGGDLPAGEPPYHENHAPVDRWQARPNVIMFVLESVRADAVGARGGTTAVTPVLDALASRGVSLQRAYSHNGYTVQSRRHIFTGSTADIRGDTLLDDFKANGYQTAYFSAQDESFGGASQGIGFERFDVAYDARADRDRRFSRFSTAGSLALPFNVIVEKVGEFLGRRTTTQPLFLVINFQDTHFPYHHAGLAPLVSDVVVPQARIAPEQRDSVRAMYLNTVANVDRAIGDVLSSARKTLGTDVGVVVLSDHGESLFDEGFLGHGYALNDVQTRIPVVISGLPLAIEEPFGEADLRDALRAALAHYDPSVPPARRQNDSRRVFQYLGGIRRPSQIAAAGLHQRVVYDFREGKVRFDAGAWMNPDELGTEERSAFLTLIHTWERMMLARAEQER
jgi:hypothetical protein